MSGSHSHGFRWPALRLSGWLVVLLLAIGVVEEAEAKTIRPGELKARKGTIEWKDDIRLKGDVVVPAGAELVILPGTTVTIDASEENLTPGDFEGTDQVDIFVLGTLTVAGNRASEVTFQSSDDSQWGGLWLAPGPRRHRLAYATIEQGTVGLHGGTANLWVTNATFSRNDTAIVLHGGGQRVEKSTFTANGTGLRFRDGDIQVQGCTFQGNRVAVVEGPGPSLMEDILFTQNALSDSSEYHVLLEAGVTEERLLLFNWWGTTNEEDILPQLGDGRQHPGRGRVTFFPFLTGKPVQR